MKLNTDGFPEIILKAVEEDTYELPERTLCKKYFEFSRNVLELGAAVGAVGSDTVNTWPHLNWVAYDANPWCVERAKENFKLNKAKGTIKQGVVMVAKDDKTIPFYVREEFWNSSLDSLDPEYSKTVEVIDVPVFEFNELHKLHKTDFDTLLIDIEGGEDDLLNDTLNLKPYKGIVIEFHPQVYGENTMYEIKDYLVLKGFEEIEAIGVVSYFRRPRG